MRDARGTGIRRGDIKVYDSRPEDQDIFAGFRRDRVTRRFQPLGEDLLEQFGRIFLNTICEGAVSVAP